ncbi:MAG: DEAD/DEAH box helicase [Bacteroidaceae bacterium]|nr:DEAD/DEAH box helicase [Bacteroidaceae bacterium]
MAKFEIGNAVQSVSSGEVGTIVMVYPKKPGKQLYDVVFESGHRKTVLEVTLMAIVNQDDPFDCCAKGIYGSNSDFACINTSYKIRNTNNNTISSLKASKTIFKAYQFKPLLKFLNSRNHRVLIADEVGLGKTIEAGHIMLELHSRRELKNALIVCPKSLMEKWQTELKDKFGFEFGIYDMDALVHEMKNRDGFVRAIVNYEKVRDNDNNKLLQLLETTNKRFDFVLCDEAHRMRNRNQAFYGIKKILESPCAAVFLTATPVMISEENLFNLLSLLDPDQYGNYAVFQNSLAINAPFITAISQINSNIAFPTIRQYLKEAEFTTFYSIGDDGIYCFRDTATIEDRFKDSPLYQRVIRDLEFGKEDNETRVRIQSDLSSLSPMNTVFSRTRKKEITTDYSQAERDTHTTIVELFEEEKRNYDNVINEYLDSSDCDFSFELNSKRATNALGLIQRKRMVSSSVFASLSRTEDLENGYDKFSDYPDSKVDSLVNIISALKADGLKHLIVFAVFKDTLRYLAIRLAKLGFQTIQIHGDIPSEERFKRIEQFRNVTSFTVLLSSEVGSEGLDMQFCNAMVNYDLPWNPMVVEQRIGRIDRFGQKSEKVHIYNLVMKDSIQVDIYSRLLDRIGIFKNCIGDLEAILDKDLEKNGIRNIQEWFTKLEKEIYVSKRSKEEICKMLDDVAKAMIAEKNNLEEVSEGLTNTLTNDLYFKREIETIDELNRYVTGHELLNYVKLLIEKRLPSCVLLPHPSIKDAYLLKIPQAQPKILSSFLEEFYPAGHGQDLEVLNRQFKSRIFESTEIELTFNQDVAYNNKRLEFINAYHPLITSAYLFFNSGKHAFGHTFNFELNSADFKNKVNLETGDYYMALYVLEAEKTMYGRTQKIELLTPILYDTKTGLALSDNRSANVVYAKSQESGVVSYLADAVLSSDAVLNMRYEMTERINVIRTEFMEDQSILIESYKDMQTKQYQEYYQFQLAHLNDTYQKHLRDSQDAWSEDEREKARKILPIDKYNIEKMEFERDNAMETINSASVIEKEPHLISISHITLK